MTMKDTENKNTIDSLYNKMFELEEENKYDEAVSTAEKLLSLTDDKDFCWDALIVKGISLLRKGMTFRMNLKEMSEEEFRKNCEKRTRCLDLAYDSFCEAEEISHIPDARYYQAETRYYLSDSYDEYLARRLYIDAMSSDDSSIREAAKERYNELNSNLVSYFNCYAEKKGERYATIGKFTNLILLQDRQFLLFAENEDKIPGYYDPDEIIQWVFTLDKMPIDIRIEGGAKANTLYVVHPMRSNVYLPYNRYEEMLFKDKVLEFCRLCKCLGAVEINIETIEGEQVTEDVQCDLQPLAPDFKRHCPDDLVWLKSDSSWNNLISFRLEGNAKTWTHYISSSEIVQLPQKRIDAAVKAYKKMMEKVNADYDANLDDTFEETEWVLKVKF